jgi:hypothetical protein
MNFSEFKSNIAKLREPLEELQDLFSAMPLSVLKTIALSQNQWVGPESGEVVGEPSFLIDEEGTPCIVYYTNLGGTGYIAVDEDLLQDINQFNTDFDISIFEK